jgi:hypothetical protein
VLIKLFSVSIFSQSCDNSMSSVSNKLKMSKSELCSCLQESFCSIRDLYLSDVNQTSR